MSASAKTIEARLQRMIPAAPDEVFDAWLDASVPGNPWHLAEKFVLDAKVDGLFYWSLKGTAHYGRFTEVERPTRLAHTWVSPNTLGAESTVQVTFEEQGGQTLMTLLHAGLPDNDRGRGHEQGWNYFLDQFSRLNSSPAQPASVRKSS